VTAVQEKARDVVHAIEHPVATAKALEHEAADGWSARTPAIVIVGIIAVVTVIFIAMTAVIMTLYYLFGGA
jgi:hypothetical protein